MRAGRGPCRATRSLQLAYDEKHNHTSDIRAEFVSTVTLTIVTRLRGFYRRPTRHTRTTPPRPERSPVQATRPLLNMSETTALPSADELLTGVSKHAHGSVDGLEDSENKKIDWRAVGAGLRHYSRA